MNKSTVTILKYLLFLGVGVLLLWFAFRKVDLHEAITKIAHANFMWIGLSILASLVAFASRAIRWNMLIEPLGHKPNIRITSAALMIGYLVNLVLPRFGEVSRCATINRTDKVPLDQLIGTVITERILDVICLLLLILFAAAIQFSTVLKFLHEKVSPPLHQLYNSIIHSTLILIILSASVLIIVILLIRMKNKIKESFQRLKKFLKGFLNGVASIKKVKNPVAFIFHTVLIWTMYYFMSYTCFFALPATSGLDWKGGLFVLAAGAIGMSVPIPGGTGSYHASVAQALAYYGINETDRGTFALMMHTSQTLIVIIFGGLSFLYLFLKQRNASRT